MATSMHYRSPGRRGRIKGQLDAQGRHHNGIDYVVVDKGQCTLSVFFLGKAPAGICKANVRVDGGVRVTGIRVTDAWRCGSGAPDRDDCLKVRVERPGDFSTYTLRLVEPDPADPERPGDEPLHGLDIIYSQIEFRFKVDCPAELDVAPGASAPAPQPSAAAISYLAKDYAGFRQLVLDRMAVTMPQWTERHAADLGVALVELLAYVGDRLSYYQDAVATEAYLHTARQRISVRRHARLVGYRLHEGCNARAWVCVELWGAPSYELAPHQYYFISPANDDALHVPGRTLDEDDLTGIGFENYEVFEPMPQHQKITLYESHNCIRLYTWGNTECQLPRGATAATLVGQLSGAPGSPPLPAGVPLLHVRPGDVLIFEELLGPQTGDPADADPAHRHAVRLTNVEPSVDELDGTPVVEIGWDPADALPFPLCLSALAPGPGTQLIDISAARGNVLLADHGRTVGEVLPDVSSQLVLSQSPLTHCEPFPQAAYAARRQAQILRDYLRREQARQDERRARLGGLLRRLGAIAGQGWNPEREADLRQLDADLAGLVRQFEAKQLAADGLVDQVIAELVQFFRHAEASPEQGEPTEAPQHQGAVAAALDRLLKRQAGDLARQFRRLGELAERAEDGYLLGFEQAAEIQQIGQGQLAAAISCASPALFGPAALAMRQNPRAALPAITLAEDTRAPDTAGDYDRFASDSLLLRSQGDGRQDAAWRATLDLLAAEPAARAFVAEIDNNGQAHLRFGDGALGAAPPAGVPMRACYRVGNGEAGRVGSDAISHIVFRSRAPLGARAARRPSGIELWPRNPMPAGACANPEPIEQARLLAPAQFRHERQRAITANDYAELAVSGFPGRVQRAAAELRWTGSWYEVCLAIDPLGANLAEPALLEEVRRFLEPYRRIGHDLRVVPARYVPIDLALGVCVLPEAIRAHVRAALLGVFSNRDNADGTRGLFHPDRLTFGTSIYLSQLIAAAVAVPGVETARADTLERLFEGPNGELEQGILPIGRLEIGRLDSDPDFPEHGRLRLELRGGR